MTQAGGGNTASYSGDSKIPFSKSLLKSSPPYGVPCFGVKMRKCLSVYYQLLLQLSSQKPWVDEQLIGVCVMWAEGVHGVTVLAHLAHLVLL